MIIKNCKMREMISKTIKNNMIFTTKNTKQKRKISIKRTNIISRINL